MAGALTCLARSQVRSVDERAIREFGMLGLVLMENAGRGAAEHLHRIAPPNAKTMILAGLGNNGGDGFVIARHWELLRGVKPTVIVVAGNNAAFESKMSSDAAANFAILQRAGFEFSVVSELAGELKDELKAADVIVDALLGTGSRGQLREPMRSVVAAANRSKALRVAVDIPSGLDCDTGEPGEICFQAHHTLTFVASKVGFRNPKALHYLGQVDVVDIGVPKRLLDSVLFDEI